MQTGNSHPVGFDSRPHSRDAGAAVEAGPNCVSGTSSMPDKEQRTPTISDLSVGRGGCGESSITRGEKPVVSTGGGGGGTYLGRKEMVADGTGAAVAGRDQWWVGAAGVVIVAVTHVHLPNI